MSGSRDTTLQALRLKYNAPLAAHQGCMRALTEASMAGAIASSALIESEAKAPERSITSWIVADKDKLWVKGRGALAGQIGATG